MLHLRVNSIFPIIYFTNSKDISDKLIWAPCFLRKIQKEQYEVLDMHKRDKVDEDKDLGGDEGLLASWTMYHKYPTTTFVNSFRLQIETPETNDKAVNISPRRLSLYNQATANVQKKADAIKANVMKTSPQLVFKVGDVVLIPLNDVDHTKVDGANLASVVVLINKDKSTFWVAVKQGLMHHAYAYHVLKPVPEASNNLDVMDLRDALNHWKGLPKISEQEAACNISSVRGQGIVHCNCRGSCTTNSCMCKKASRLCSSRCHRNSKCCKNTHDA
jgi:hypothetical protein